MVDAIISKGSTSVTLPILESGGQLAIARDGGKPNLNEQEIGLENPIFTDYWSQNDVFTVIGRLRGSSAYSNAKTLAESIVKPQAVTGTPIQLDLSSLPQHSTYDVAVTPESALQLEYFSGRGQEVAVQFQGIHVTETIGAEQSSPSNLSADAGSGVKITDGSNSVTFSGGVSVSRSVGRPAGKIHQTPNALPSWWDRTKPANDTFSITARNVSESDATKLFEDIAITQLGDQPIELHFQGNEFGLDAYNVFPVGSAANRYVFNTGQTGRVTVPTLELQVATKP